MKVTFLGTGTSQGIPVIACKCDICQSKDPRDKRLRSSIMVEQENSTIVIDCGPDFRQQMLTHQVQKLDAILFTHEHRDHIAGLDDVRSYNHLSGSPMDIYGEKRVLNALKKEFPYIFAKEKYPGVPSVTLHEISLSPFSAANIEVNPVRVFHYKLPVLGFRINDFAYITDASYIPEGEKKKLLDLKYLVINGLRNEPHISHFTLDQAVELIREVKPVKGFITHISHLLGFHEEVQKELPSSIHLAHDNLVLEWTD